MEAKYLTVGDVFYHPDDTELYLVKKDRHNESWDVYGLFDRVVYCTWFGSEVEIASKDLILEVVLSDCQEIPTARYPSG